LILIREATANNINVGARRISLAENTGQLGGDAARGKGTSGLTVCFCDRCGLGLFGLLSVWKKMWKNTNVCVVFGNER
jgi:hypothetical protein